MTADKDEQAEGVKAADEVPEKVYYRIGEVARLTGVKPYVLRYWESEFRAIRPAKSLNGQRLYQRRDIDVLLEIKRLLYDEKYTIPGAKKQLRALAPPADDQLPLTFDGVAAAADSERADADDSADEGATHESVATRSPPSAALAEPSFDELPRLELPFSPVGGGAEPGASVTPASTAPDTEPRAATLEDPTSTALVDQALREAHEILDLAARGGVVR